MIHATCHMSSVSSSTPRRGSVRLVRQALSIWLSMGGAAPQSQNLSSDDVDTNAYTTSSNMQQSDFNQNPWRI
jgi:hypothetical protein